MAFLIANIFVYGDEKELCFFYLWYLLFSALDSDTVVHSGPQTDVVSHSWAQLQIQSGEMAVSESLSDICQDYVCFLLKCSWKALHLPRLEFMVLCFSSDSWWKNTKAEWGMKEVGGIVHSLGRFRCEWCHQALLENQSPELESWQVSQEGNYFQLSFFRICLNLY